jgi:hypothetical protein
MRSVPTKVTEAPRMPQQRLLYVDETHNGTQAWANISIIVKQHISRHKRKKEKEK